MRTRSGADSPQDLESARIPRVVGLVIVLAFVDVLAAALSIAAA